MKSFVRACLLVAVSSFASHLLAQDPSLASTWFLKNSAWAAASDVKLNAANQLEATPSPTGDALFFLKTPETSQLRSPEWLGDAIVRFDFMVQPDTKAGVYLESRYRVELSADDLGSVGPLEADKDASASTTPAPPVPPTMKVAARPGTWQTFEARFRSPRLDDARNKTEDALLIDVRIDGHIVQSNVVQTHWSAGAELKWDDTGGPTNISVENGHLAIRHVAIHRADFSAVKVPAVSGQATNLSRLIDLVRQGDENFHSFGCVECHAVQPGDTSQKAGPNLYGLFRLEPRDRIIAAGEGHRFTIKADRAYLQRSVRTPPDEIAIGEHGPNEGKPYPPVMPPFLPTVLSDQQIDAIYSYFLTLNDRANQGPVVRLAEPAKMENYDPMTDRLQLLVDRTVRFQRGPMEHVSGRSIHVGLPNGINYTFDPRLLAIVQVWQGGYLDMSGEYLNRGGRGIKMGYNSREIDLGSAGSLLAPLDPQGQAIDFSFKDAVFQDAAAIRDSLNSTEDHLARLAKIDAQFLGYSRDSRDPAAAPIFSYRVGQNQISVQTTFADDGRVEFDLTGTFATPQSFTLDTGALGDVTVSTGEVRKGSWTLPAGKYDRVSARGRLAFAPKAWHAKPSTFDHRVQKLVVSPSSPTLPAGYSAETYLGPKDNYGRDQLFEALGLAVAPDGTLVVATRTAGIWRLVKGEWHLFADGFFDSLGVQVEDEHGLKVVVGQKAELTRVSDTNGDGLADRFETLSDAFSYHGNYHSYMHGPVRAPDGTYFYSLNLDDASSAEYEYRAGGKYMGTAGGYRGWLIHVPPQGGFEPWANGMRSPAGLGFAPDGRFWYTDNQGEYMGTSKLFVVKKGAFYGHPAGLVDLPGMGPISPEIAWEKVAPTRQMPVVLFPEGRLANSPGNPSWDTTNGKFGPYAGQMWVGDQTQSILMRVITERVGEHEQGVAIPFAYDLESGVMRQVVMPDDSFLLGETGRGWQAKGGRVASLQRIVWDGKTIPPSYHHVSAVPDGFELVFTVPVPAGVSNDDLGKALVVKSWVYRDAPDYGSPELDDHVEPVARVEISSDRTRAHVVLVKIEQPKIHPQQTARVYQLTLAAKNFWPNAGPGFDAFYTLYEFPKPGN